MAYSQHAHRSTIELADVELLMKRFALELFVYYINLTLHYPLDTCMVEVTYQTYKTVFDHITRH